MRIDSATPRFLALLLALLLAGCASHPEPAELPSYEVGDLLAPAQLEDQFGTPQPIDDTVHVLLFAGDMDGGKLIRSVLDELGAAALSDADGIYIADIHEMPSLVSRTMAIPSMRERPYSILLDRTGQVSAQIPRQPGHATLMRMEAGRIWEIELFDDEAALKAALSEN